MSITNVLEKLTAAFPPKEGCKNGIFLADIEPKQLSESQLLPCKIGLSLWVNQETFRCFYLDSEDELNDMDNLITEIQNLLSNEIV
jgi:hypothetical protein